MGRFYSVPIDDVSFSVAGDIFQLCPASNKPIRLAGIFIWQRTDVGDANEEILRCNVIRRTGTTTNGTSGTSVTPQPIGATEQAAGFLALRSITQANQGSGTDTSIMPLAWNIRAGLELWLPPEARPQFITGDATQEAGCILRMATAPNSAVAFNGFVVVEEEG